MRARKHESACVSAWLQSHFAVLQTMLARESIGIDVGWHILLVEGFRPLEQYLETGLSPEEAETMPILEQKRRHNVEDVPPPVSDKAKLFRADKYMRLYDVVYDLASDRLTDGNVAVLYERYGETISAYLRSSVLPSLQASIAAGPDTFLRDFRRRWGNHCVYIFPRVFQDRSYSHTLKKEPLERRGLDAFLEIVYKPYRNLLTTELLSLVNKERNGEKADRELIWSLVSVYVRLSKTDCLELYQADFEEALLPASRSYYAQKGGEWITVCDFPEYLRRVEKALAGERERAIACFHEGTRPKLLAVCQVGLLTSRLPELLTMENPISRLLEDNCIEDLQRCYLLFGLLENGYEPIAEALKSYCATKVADLVSKHSAVLQAEIAAATAAGKNIRALTQKQLSCHPEIVEDFLNLHERLNGILHKCFEQELSFQRAVKEAFEMKLNHNIGPHTPGALLCAYTDQLLRGSKTLSPEETEATLTKIVQLFVFLTDKDLFSEIYRNQLSRRLLAETSASIDLERLMLSKLKMRCGAHYTARHEGMLADLATANDIQRKFRQAMIEKAGEYDSFVREKFDATVLTSGHWPTYEILELKLPPQMQNCLDTFTLDYCMIRTNHRRIMWVHHLGTCIISARFGQGQTYDLQCNTPQAVVLLLFNEHEERTVAEIQQETAIPVNHLRKLLTCFLVAKVLLKTGESPEEVYRVNDALKLKSRLLKVPVPAQEESHSTEKTEEDRSVAIEAAIVRFLKARKTAKYAQLVADVIGMLPLFRPSPQQIKQKVEDLIEREFIRRDADDVSLTYFCAPI